MRNSIPDLLIEQAALGELSNAELEALKKECDLDARIAELDISNREILSAYPTEEMADRIRLRAGLQQQESEPNAGQEPARGRIIEAAFKLALPIAAAAALLIAVMLPGLQPGSMTGANENGAAGIRLKGMEPHMKIYRRSGNEAEELHSKQSTRENDLLQISYVAGGAEYGVILSIDGRGAVTLHHPDSPRGDQRLAEGGEYALPFSYQLDDAPGFERFYFISGNKEIPMDLLMDEAERVSISRTGKWVEEFQLPDEYSQQSILLLKEASR